MTLSKDARILWQTAKALALKSQAVSPPPRGLPPLIFFTDPQRTPDPSATARHLPKGAGVVYRHFGAPDALRTAEDLRQITRDAGVSLLIGLDADLAQAIGADGVHLPERALDQARALRQNHPDWLLTGAIHQINALPNLQALDAAVVSPVFPAGGASANKAELGLSQFARICASLPCPVYGLGGITPERAPLMLDTGACGIAGVNAIVEAFKA